MKPLSARQKDFLYRSAVYGRLRLIAKPIYDALIAGILLVNRIRDKLYPLDQSDISSLHIVIKTFERDKAAARLIKSIKRRYPHAAITVVNDSRHPITFEGVNTIVMPYDSGISAGRNKAISEIDSPYFLLLDDDFVFSHRQNLGALIKQLDAFPDIDILGGRCIDLPFNIVHDVQNQTLNAYKTPRTPLGTMYGSNRVVDKVTNFFIARTQRVRLVGWNNELKIFEHADFFSRAKGVLTTAYAEDMLILHAKTPFDRDYLTKRFRPSAITHGTRPDD